MTSMMQARASWVSGAMALLVLTAACSSTAQQASPSASPSTDLSAAAEEVLPEGAHIDKKGQVVNKKGEVIGTAEEFGLERTKSGKYVASDGSNKRADGGRTRSGGSSSSAPPAVGGTITIGIVIDTGNPGAPLGVRFTTDTDALRRAFQALADYVNKTGGFAGRKIELAFAEVDRTDDSESTQVRYQNEACTYLTEDVKAFLVISASSTTWYGADCYVQHQTPLVAGSTGNEAQSRGRAPWIVPAVTISPERYARLIARSLAEQDFMTDKMGLLALDTPTYRAPAEKILIPSIAKQGGKIIDTFYLRREYSELSAGTQSAVLRFQRAGIDRVVTFLPATGGLWAIFARQAENQGYRPRYGVTTYDSPALIYGTGLIPKEQLRGTVGTSVNMATDISRNAQPPLAAKEKRCFERAGVSYETRSNLTAYITLVGCDYFFLIQQALAPRVGRSLVKTQILDLVSNLGSSFESTRFTRTNFANPFGGGIAEYAHMAWDHRGCECFKLTSPWKNIPF